MKCTVEMIEKNLIITLVKADEQGSEIPYMSLYHSEESEGYISSFIASNFPNIRHEVSKWNKTDLMNYFIDEISDEISQHNIREILNLTANNKAFQDPEAFRLLFAQCFISELNQVAELTGKDESTKVSGNSLEHVFSGINHTMIYECHSYIQVVYAIEMLHLRSKRCLKKCRMCDRYLVAEGKHYYCSTECATKARREQEKRSHKNLSDEAALWRKIQQRLQGRIDREPRKNQKELLEKEFDAIKEERLLEKDRPNGKYLSWLKKKDAETKKG